MRVDIRISNPRKSGSERINVLLIVLLLICEAVSLFVFFAFSKLLGSISLIMILVLFFILIGFLNKFFYIDILRLEIIDSKLFVTLNNGTNEFDLKFCKLAYHLDKDEWISLDYKDRVYSWTLVKPVTKETISFIHGLNK